MGRTVTSMNFVWSRSSNGFLLVKALTFGWPDVCWPLKNQHQRSPFFFNATLKTTIWEFLRMDPSERAAGKKNAISFLFHCVSKDVFWKTRIENFCFRFGMGFLQFSLDKHWESHLETFPPLARWDRGLPGWMMSASGVPKNCFIRFWRMDRGGNLELAQQETFCGG